MAAFGNAAD